METIKFSGATGPQASHVNGLFDLTTERLNGAPVWKKHGACLAPFLGILRGSAEKIVDKAFCSPLAQVARDTSCTCSCPTWGDGTSATRRTSPRPKAGAGPILKKSVWACCRLRPAGGECMWAASSRLRGYRHGHVLYENGHVSHVHVWECQWVRTYVFVGSRT